MGLRMKPKKIFLVAAARPNFMKIAPLYHAFKSQPWALPLVIHTGQHYDCNMSGSFFEDLGVPEPFVNLGVGSGSHAEQTGKVMVEFEKFALRECPDLTIVVGDVNSTMGCAISAAKLCLKSAHLEAGLRSFDRTMPEEINRIVTDTLVDILWTPSEDANANLMREGVSQEKIRLVGNIMIDSLELLRDKIERMNALELFGLEPKRFAVVTLHRPSNVDEEQKLEQLCDLLTRTAEKIRIVFPVHPRTRSNLETFDLIRQLKGNDRLILTEPLNYLTFMNLVFDAGFVMTDSGGIQEETTYLGIPCLTLRDNTERPVTVIEGTNRLCNLSNIEDFIERALQGRFGKNNVPHLWDGRTAQRVVEHVKNFLC